MTSVRGEKPPGQSIQSRGCGLHFVIPLNDIVALSVSEDALRGILRYFNSSFGCHPLCRCSLIALGKCPRRHPYCGDPNVAESEFAPRLVK